ncbi:MAG: class I SAM-dependent methyltransferase, partial [Parachlamydiales bacterium]|nr:class I SAM-dependent methyltransferase [Parachlamydiales bacterium]
MKKRPSVILVLFIFMMFFTPSIFAWEGGQKYLQGRIPCEDRRFNTFLHSLRLMEERGVKVMVETGTSRCGCDNCIGDGCSTIIFADFAYDHEAILYSVDIDRDSLLRAKNAVSMDKRSVVSFIHSDSVAFLKNFGQLIDFLYLDSFDYEDENPNPSQQHHLNEIIAAYPWLHSKSIVMIDDCAFPNGGKGKLVMEYLVRRGWKVVKNQYQVILVRK